MNRALVLCCVLASSAFADSITDVDALYGEGEFDQAIKKADAAIARSKNANEVAKLQLAKGLALLAIGKSDKARAAFVAGLNRDTSVRLDSSRVGPDALELFNRALAEFPATVTISVSNGDGAVRIDGQAMGPAPLTTQLTAGTHVFEVTASDGRTVRAEEKIEAGARTPVTLTLPSLTTKPVADAPLAPTKPVATIEPESPPPLPPAETTKPATKHSLAGLAPLIGGAVVAAGGVLCLVSANNVHRQLTDPNLGARITGAEQYANEGKTFQALGWIGTTVGGAAMVAGVVMLALPVRDDSKPTVSAFMTPGGGMVSVQGSLP